MPEPVDQLIARIAKLLRARRELDRRLTEYQDELRRAIGEPEDIHDWMRRVNRRGRLGVVTAALLVVRRPLQTAAAFAVIGGSAAAWYLAPWANGEEQPDALPGRPAITQTASPTPTRTLTPTPTATPSPTRTPGGTPEPAPTDEEPGQPVTAAGREQDRQLRRGRPGDRPPEFPPDRDERDCAVPVRIDVPDLVEVGVCVSPLLG